MRRGINLNCTLKIPEYCTNKTNNIEIIHRYSKTLRPNTYQLELVGDLIELTCKGDNIN